MAFKILNNVVITDTSDVTNTTIDTTNVLDNVITISDGVNSTPINRGQPVTITGAGLTVVTESNGIVSIDASGEVPTNISAFTNDVGYITSETDSQTLSFSNPNLTISNGNSVDLSTLSADLTGYATEAYVDTAESDANLYTDGREILITTAYESYADTVETDANAYTDSRETAITSAYQTYADTAEADANTYTDTRETAITSAYQTYADTAEADAIATAATDATTKADTAEADAISAANIYTDFRDTTLIGDSSINGTIGNTIKNRIDSAEADAIATAATDATTKANNALASAQTYADALDTSDIAENGPLYYTNERVDDRVSNLLVAGSNITLTYNDSLNTLSIASATTASGGYDLSANTTDDLTEGASNLYFTSARVQTIIDAGSYATETFVNNSISSIVDAAPATLDTLNELAAALGDDANFSTTITNQIANKANTADLATVATSGSYADLTNKPTIPTNNNQLTNGAGYITTFTDTNDFVDSLGFNTTNGILTVGRTGSLLDLTVDLDGRYVTSTFNTEDVQDIVGGMVSGNTESGISVTYDDTNGKLNFNVNDPVITLNGDLSGSATMTNLNNVTIAASVADNSHNHTIANVTGLQTDLNGKVNLSGSTMTGGLIAPTLRATATADVSATSTGHGFQVGATTGQNIAIDSNEIIARNNGTLTTLYLQTDGQDTIFGNNTANKVQIGSGAIIATGDITAYGTVSDRRQKENIQRLENSLDKVNQLNGYTFNYLNHDDRMTGVMAQEVQEVLPEAVFETNKLETEDGVDSILAVRHGNMVGLLIEAIKEQQTQIELLKQEVDNLKNKV